MSRKHAELEREFLDELALRTGRSLAAWMDAIDTTGIDDRNAIIDWLRPQGLTFAHASWLERIHHNGGRPIYIGSPGTGTPAIPSGIQPSAPRPPSSTPTAPVHQPLPTAEPPAAAIATRTTPVEPLATAASIAPALPTQGAQATGGPIGPVNVFSLQRRAPPVQSQPAPTPQHAPPPHANPPPRSTLSDGVGHIISRGKGLRMLAEHILREIARTVPGTAIVASGDLVSFRAPGEFAVLAVSPKDLRLGLALPPHAVAPVLQGVRIPGARPHITRMAVLDDARQVDAQLLSLVHLAQQSLVPM